MVVAPLHGFDLTAPPDFESGLVQGGLQLGYTLFDGGARGARLRAARALEEAAAAGSAAAEAQVVVEVSAAYLGVLVAAELVAAQDQGLDALRAERERVSSLLEEGRAARVELLRVEAALAQAQAERIASASQLDAGEHALARLLGVEPERTRASGLRAVRLRPAAAAQERLAAMPAEQNPEVAQADGVRAAADAGGRAAGATWFPRLDVGGGYILFGSTAGEFTAEWQAGVRLTYPLFTGGTRAGAVRRARAQADAARERYRLTRLAVDTERDRAAAAAHEQRARVEANTTAVRHLEEVTRIERLALDAGARTQPDYLRAEAELRRARAVLIRARYDEIAAVVRLARAAGVLTAAWLDQMLETTP
jgi:outer membrane protein TolC